jgi:hypothetical protein
MDRGQYSPPTKNHPQQLPDYWKFEDGTIRTDLPELSDDELAELGWHGPIQMPPFEGTSYFTHSYEWNSETLSFDAVDLQEEEKRKMVRYQKFWDDLINTTAYKKIKTISSQSLLANTIATEFIALLTDAKNNHANVEKIQEVLLEIVENIPFSQEELGEIEKIFIDSGMYAVYTL